MPLQVLHQQMKTEQVGNTQKAKKVSVTKPNRFFIARCIFFKEMVSRRQAHLLLNKLFSGRFQFNQDCNIQQLLSMDRSPARSRQREFSNTRISYSRSQLNRSQLNNENLSPSRNTQQPRNQQVTPQPAHSHQPGLVCVDCYNRKLSLEKHKRSQREKQDDGRQTTLSKLDDDKHRNTEIAKNQLKKMNDYNVRKIQENQRRQEEERKGNTGKDGEDIQRQEKQYKDEVEQRRQLDQDRRKQLRQDLEKQIAYARNRRQQAEEEAKQGVSKPIIDKTATPQERQQVENEHKQKLLQQINDNRVRKRQEEEWEKEENKRDNQLPFVRNADNMRQLAEQLTVKSKENAKEELRRKAEAEQAKREADNRQREEDTRLRQQQEKEVSNVAHKTEEERRNHIEKYLRDLKKQMKDNQVRREEELKWINAETDNCILAPKQQPTAEPCASCYKPYPKRQLSPFITYQQP